MTAVAGPSGAGKTALVLESLVPALRAAWPGEKTPKHVRRLDAAGIRGLAEIDATPIGQNSRSTPATYSGAFDAIRQAFADTPLARRRGWKPGHFSFNTKAGPVPASARASGYIDIDVQYLPDIRETCPLCHGVALPGGGARRPARRADASPTCSTLTVHDAVERFAGRPAIVRPLRPVDDVGLGYLRLGEETPSLSGGESQRLRIASRLRSSQRGILYVFDEPSTGLHPVDIAHAGRRVRPAARRRRDRRRHRPRPRPAGGGRPPHRHGPGRRPGRRAGRRRGHAAARWPRTPTASPAPTWPGT